MTISGSGDLSFLQLPKFYLGQYGSLTKGLSANDSLTKMPIALLECYRQNNYYLIDDYIHVYSVSKF